MATEIADRPGINTILLGRIKTLRRSTNLICHGHLLTLALHRTGCRIGCEVFSRQSSILACPQHNGRSDPSSGVWNPLDRRMVGANPTDRCFCHPALGRVDSRPVDSFPVQGGDKTVPLAPTAERPEKFRVTIRRPSGPPTIELQQPDSQGRVGRVACSTCHSIREPNFENRKPSDLKRVPSRHAHASMVSLSCYACHNPDDSDTLRLADGSAVEYADVMNLCAQCHGSQGRATPGGFTVA